MNDLINLTHDLVFLSIFYESNGKEKCVDGVVLQFFDKHEPGGRQEN